MLGSNYCYKYQIIFKDNIVIGYYQLKFKKQIQQLELMLKNSSKQRLRMAHEVLDKELSGNSFLKSATTISSGDNSGNGYRNTNSNLGLHANTKQKQSDNSNKSKNVQSEISQLERKLLELEKKMQNIDVSSSNQDDREESSIMRIIGKKNSNAFNNNNYKDRNRQFQTKNSQKEVQGKVLSKEKIKNQLKNMKLGQRNSNNGQSSNQSAQQDSSDDIRIYQRIQQKEKQKKSVAFIEKDVDNQKKDSNLKGSINQKPNAVPTNTLKSSAAQNKEKFNQNQVSKKSLEQPMVMMKQSLKQNNLRNSVKSVASNKSKKSRGSVTSQKERGSIKKLQRSSSKKSIDSRKSHGSVDKKIGHGGLSTDQFRQIQLQNAKDNKKITNLQRQLNHYKRLCLKQQQKLEQYRIMQIQFRKLQANFAKSQQIRKQQKKIIENLKNKN